MLVESAEETVQLFVRTHGVDGLATTRAREGLATALEGADRWVEARVVREEVLSARRRNKGDEDLGTLNAELHLGVILNHVGLIAEALPLAIHGRGGFERLGEAAQADVAANSVSSIRAGNEFR
jgi:hypothetical protein